jgi:hypothetical protein
MNTDEEMMKLVEVQGESLDSNNYSEVIIRANKHLQEKEYTRVQFDNFFFDNFSNIKFRTLRNGFRTLVMVITIYP